MQLRRTHGDLNSQQVTVCCCLLLVLVLAPSVFLRVVRFSQLHKNQHSKFQFDLETVDEEPLRGICHCKFLFIFIFYFIFSN